MKSCDTKESMKYEMRPVNLALATAALGTAMAWAGIVTSLITGYGLGTTVLFSAAIPCLIASAIFSAIAAVRLGKPPESRHREEQPGEGETPG